MAHNRQNSANPPTTLVVKNSAVSFFEERYPLIRLFRFGDDILLYDAKPHFAFRLSENELDVLVDYLRPVTGDALADKYPSRLEGGSRAALLSKFADLARAGVFLPGSAESISPTDRREIEELVRYYDQNILLRKFCLEVTQDCNFRCAYCKKTVASGYKGHNKLTMQMSVAQSGIDYYFRKYTQIYDKLGEQQRVKLLETLPPSLSWYGGEPFLNFKLIRQSAAYFKSLPWERHSIPAESLRFSAATNLSILNETIIRFLIDNHVRLFVSLDGPEEEHDRSRVFVNRRGTFRVVYRNLCALKNADAEYFRTHVTVLSVYTEQHDRAKCQKFVHSLDALNYEEFRAEYVGMFVPDVECTLAQYKDRETERYLDFQSKALAESEFPDPHVERFASLFSFATINFDHPVAPSALRCYLTCPMGFDNLMLSAGGDFLICHKVDDSMPIGRCETGLDYDRLADVYDRYSSAINNPECKSCWAMHFCGVCAATRMAGGRFVNPHPRECDYFRTRMAYEFSCFAYLAAELPTLWDKIWTYRHDKGKYIGIVDVNEF